MEREDNMITIRNPAKDVSPVVIERTYDAPVETVWKAVTNKEQMKHWYFDLKEFEPEIGFEFQFHGGTEQKQYLHLCKYWRWKN